MHSVTNYEVENNYKNLIPGREQAILKVLLKLDKIQILESLLFPTINRFNFKFPPSNRFAQCVSATIFAPIPCVLRIHTRERCGEITCAHDRSKDMSHVSFVYKKKVFNSYVRRRILYYFDGKYVYCFLNTFSNRLCVEIFIRSISEGGMGDNKVLRKLD